MNFKIKPRDKTKPSRGTLSTKKAKKLLGFKPEYNLKKGIKKYFEFLKKNEIQSNYEYNTGLKIISTLQKIEKNLSRLLDTEIDCKTNSKLSSILCERSILTICHEGKQHFQN